MILREKKYMSLCSYSADSHSGSFLVIENTFINDYLPSAPDSCVKVYLYGLYLCSNPTSSLNSIENIMHTLGLSAGEVKDAFLYWQGEGLVQLIENTSTNELVVKYLPIHHRVASAKKYANKYADFNSKIQAIITTRMITPSEFNEYYTLLESFHFDEEALLQIVNYCVQLKGTSVGYPYIVTVAKSFASDGIISTESVSERLNAHEEVDKDTLNILKVFKPSTKHTSIDERNLYIKWVEEFGFTHSVIKEVAKTLKTKNDPVNKLDRLLTSYYNAKLFSLKDISAYNEEHEKNLSLAKEITRLLGLYYENLDIVIETYISDWLRKGYDENTLKTLATYCFKRSTKTLEGMNNCIQKFYKLGLVTQGSINQYIEGIVASDNVIQAILDKCNLLRNVTSSDRDAYNTWTKSWNMSDDIIMLVSDYAKDKSQPIQYMNKILSSMYDKNVSTLDEAKTYLDSFGKETRKSTKQTTKFEQREYNQKDLDALFDNLDNIEI